MICNTSPVNGDRRALACFKAFGVAIALFIPVLACIASNPTSGTVSPTAGTSVSWQGTAPGTGAANGESTCVEGVNCDSYTLTVGGTQASWANYLLNVNITWSVPANDYDLYVHKGDLTGPVIASSTNGAPETAEAVQLNPNASGVGTYTVHVVYFATTPSTDQYIGGAQVIAKPKGRVGRYALVHSGFGPSWPVLAASTTADGEPSSRCDKYGHYYVVGIRGVPAGVDMWYFDLNPNSHTYDPYMRNPQYRGQPDSFSPTQAYSVGADGGGDVDIAVGTDNIGPNNVPTIALSSLTIANVSTSISTDLGNSWQKNPTGSAGGVPVDDRQWEAFYGKNQVYLYYRTFNPAVSMIQCSTDGGLHFHPAVTAGELGQAGSIDVDQRDGTVYLSGSSGEVAIGKPDPTVGYPLTYTVVQAASDPNGVANLFFVVKVASDGTVYGAYSNGQHVFLISSSDQGLTWSKPVQVDFGPNSNTSLFPALAVGTVKGAVAVGWYGTPDIQNDDNADWRVFVAETFNALDASPIFLVTQASDHVIHASNISLGGTFGNQNRNLLDYFQICFDPVGALVVGYTDDHIDFTGDVYVTREIYGKSANGTYLQTPHEGDQLPARHKYSTDGAQVLDPEGDVTQGLLVTLPLPSPLDITEMRYSSSNNTSAGLMLSATMKVSDLSSIPAESTWRMDFAVNCPYAGLSTNQQFSMAASDRGNQFWVAANTDAQGNITYTYGTASRNSSGGIDRTTIGAADSGSFDPTTQTITVNVSASKLNAALPSGAKPIASGTVLAGLRGATYDTGSGGIVTGDATRGGLEYTIP